MKIKAAQDFKNNIRQLKEIYVEMSTIGNNIPPEGAVVKYTGYSHNWKRYIGFIESYYYCVRCDVKR